MVSVGIVCEGSHDYFFLVPIIDKILADRGIVGTTFSALQPTIDATSKQIDGGGYQAVYQWVLSNNGDGLRKYFERTLFATSTLYDLMIIHLDGDVADISSEFENSRFYKPFSSIDDRVTAIADWIRDASAAASPFLERLILAVPTLQTEAWIVAALRPNAQHIENRNRKKATKRFLRQRYTGSALDQVRAAAQDARNQVNNMKARCRSFELFFDDLSAAI